jgi:hypothetical protein
MIMSKAVELSEHIYERLLLRAYDALHLACAQAVREVLENQELPGPILIASDDTLLAAAAAEGFVVDNPLQHT